MQTKAVRIHGKMDLRLDEVALPEIGADGVRVRIACDSLCMSSYKAAIEGGDHKRIPDRCDLTPTILGHEFCGKKARFLFLYKLTRPYLLDCRRSFGGLVRKLFYII
ncbi:MAG: hypothetical protein II220_11275 [Spirochaetales bacterium]|nr:hypothetical protein [Spirochaetales bacterium]